MAEFAVVVPLFLMLLLGIVQFGIAFNNYLAVTDAVRAGARTAAVSRHLVATREEVTKQRVRDSAASLDEDELDITVASSWKPGEQVKVTAEYPYEIKIFGIDFVSGDLKSSSVERVE